MERQHAGQLWRECPAPPLELLKAAQQGMGIIMLGALLKQRLEAVAGGTWAEVCSRNFAEGRAVVLRISDATD